MQVPATALDRLLGGAVARGDVPGVTALIADRSGIVYEKAFGVRDTRTQASIGSDSMFGIASMTKTLSATLVLRLIERGQIELSTPIGDVLPAYDQLPVLDGFDGDEPILRPAARRGTVHNLLSNTSGLAHPTWNRQLLRYLEVAGIPLTELAGSRRIFEIPFVSDPGRHFHYGMSTDWLGLLIEAVTGSRFEVALRDEVLHPLGMTDTTVLRSAEQLSRSSSVHIRDTDHSWAPLPNASYYAPNVIEPEVYPAGGCLYSTAADFAKFQLLLLGGGTFDGVQLLRPETVTQMFQNQIGPLDVGLLQTEVPAASNNLPLAGWKWGYGMLVNESPVPGGRSGGSGGWGGGWNTFFWVDGARGLTAAFYTQTAPFYDADIIALYQQFEALVSGTALLRQVGP